jgi:hypothetical protein
MIGLLRALVWRRLRWLALGSAARWAIRRLTAGSRARAVEQATAEVEQRLPAPVRRLIENERVSSALPIDPVRTGGSALAAGRSAQRASRVAVDATRRLGDIRRGVTGRIDAVRGIGAEVGREAEASRRELTSRYLRATEGPGPADDALLDLRSDRSVADGFDQADPLDQVPGPVAAGRRRAHRRSRRPEVARVQRSYRPRTRPWDR